MGSIAASSDDLVKKYYDSLERLHDKVRQNTPFTYLAYRSMIPAEEDDFIGLAYKISYYITFKFFIHVAIHMASPFCAAIPFLPLCMDVVWVGYRWICVLKTEEYGDREPAPLTTLFFLSVGLITMHYLDKLPDY